MKPWLTPAFRASALAALVALGCLEPADHPSAGSSGYSRVLPPCPVLFVHGSGLASSSFDEMIRTLLRRGYPAAFLRAVDLIPSNGSNRTAASAILAPAVENLLISSNAYARDAGHSETDIRRVCMVAHSMGAVSSRWYAAKLRPDRVALWIGIAGSNHGTNALEGLDGPGNEEMVPAFASSAAESEIQIELNGSPASPIDESPFGRGTDPADRETVPADTIRRIVYFTIRIEPDFWIRPAESALLAGAGGTPIRIDSELPFRETSAGNFLADVKSKHDALPEDQDVIELVQTLLRAAGD